MELTKEIEKRLIKEAINGMNNAFTGTNKPEDMRFGSAVLTKKGNIYSSGQYYSDTLSLTLHCEQAALAHAAAHGEYEIVAIATVGNPPVGPRESIYPCHMCKQLLWESSLRSKQNTLLILLDKQGNILEKLNLLDIINYPWPKGLL